MVAAYDIVLVGGGIVGLATAMALVERFPTLKVAVLEKEAEIASHQTGHNSGVIHAGIYYKPGSLKARLCVTGARRMTAFCETQGIPYERCGKVIVAVEPAEQGALDELYRRGTANGVAGLRRIGPDELAEIEPHARGVVALHSPQTAIVDFRAVARAMAAVLDRAGADIRTSTSLRAVRPDGRLLRLETTSGDLPTRYLINCAGLHADRVAQMTGLTPTVRIVPFRGEYYELSPGRQELVRGLIYPVPDPRFPFLGVHFTRTIHGGVEAGPNAVLAFAREGYRWSQIDSRDLCDILSFPGFRRLARRYWWTGLAE
ncbi:MAG TPA: L-2-hydroxyglutarate oxidase, partial [Limnochordia bacterium]